MEGRTNKEHNHLPGVKCVVNTCTYYQEGNHCSAPKIEILPRDAHSAEETDCGTFAPKMD